LAIYNVVTGIDLDESQLIIIVYKALNLENLYNVGEDFIREDETISPFWFKEPIAGGAQKSRMLDKARFEKMKDEYYALRDRDAQTNLPAMETYKRLGLSGVADRL